MTVVDFPGAVPDPEHTAEDFDGRRMYRFAMTFLHDGSPYSFDIFAYDAEDAEKRALSVRQTASVAGQIYRTVS